MTTLVCMSQSARLGCLGNFLFKGAAFSSRACFTDTRIDTLIQLLERLRVGQEYALCVYNLMSLLATGHLIALKW